MIQRTVLYLFLLISFHQSYSQTWTWTEQQVCGTSSIKITHFTDGGFILYGTFKDSLLFRNNYLYADSGTHELFIARYDRNKNVLWSKSFGSNYMDPQFDMDQLNSLVIDQNSNLVFTGSFGKQFIYGIDTLNSIRDWQDGYIASCDSMGNPLWIRHFHGRAAESGVGLFLDDNDNIYLGCAYTDYDLEDTIVFEENHIPIDSVIIPFRGYIDNCLMKINATGKIEWVNAWGGKGDDFTNEYGFDNNGMIYVSTRFDSTIFIANDSMVSRGGKDLLILKYDTTGQLIWKKQHGNIKDDFLHVKFGDERFSYLYGQLDSITTIDGFDVVSSSGITNIFIAKIDSSGSYVDSKEFLGTANYPTISYLDLDDFGNLFFTMSLWSGNMQLDTFTVRGEGLFTSKSCIVKANENLNVLKVITAEDYGKAAYTKLSIIPSGLLVFGYSDTTLILGEDTLNSYAACSKKFLAQLDFTISIDELSNFSALELYPNPAIEKAELLITLNKPSKAIINIHSMQGVLVKSQKSGLLLNGMNRVTIDFGNKNISQGIYICTVETGNEKRAIKLVVQ